MLGSNLKLDVGGKEWRVVIYVSSGTLRMEMGSLITNARQSGVYVSGSSFTMNGGQGVAGDTVVPDTTLWGVGVRGDLTGAGSHHTRVLQVTSPALELASI